MQENTADKQAEADALWARRAQEDYERAWRAREAKAAKKKKKMLQELMLARDGAGAVQAEAAQSEQLQFERILMVQRAAESAELQKEADADHKSLAHNEEIQRQISENEEQRARRRRQEFLEEGAKMKYQKQLEIKRLEAIKQRKIAELQRSVVPEKYLAELQNKKLG